MKTLVFGEDVIAEPLAVKWPPRLVLGRCLDVDAKPQRLHAYCTGGAYKIILKKDSKAALKSKRLAEPGSAASSKIRTKCTSRPLLQQ